MIDIKVVNEYLELIGCGFLDPKKYTLIEIVPTDKKKFIDVENSNTDMLNVVEK